VGAGRLALKMYLAEMRFWPKYISWVTDQALNGVQER